MTVAQRRIREKESRKQQILVAAKDLFFEKGFDGTTIEEIAQKAELSKGTLYLYFPSKEELYITIMLEGAEILYGMLAASVSKDLPADTNLRRLGQSYYQFYQQFLGYFRMLFLYYGSPDIHERITSDLVDDCEQNAKKCLFLVADVIQRGIDAGLFKPCNAWDFAILIWTTQNGIILLSERREDEFLKLNTTMEKLHDLLVESMIVSLKSGR